MMTSQKESSRQSQEAPTNQICFKGRAAASDNACARAKSHAQNSRARFGGRNENEWRASVAEKKKKNTHTHAAAKKWLSKGAARGNNSSLHALSRVSKVLSNAPGFHFICLQN